MKRRFFKKPLFTKVSPKFYKEMIIRIEMYQETNCRREDGSCKCSTCPFSISPYCLLNILKTEFGGWGK